MDKVQITDELLKRYVGSSSFGFISVGSNNNITINKDACELLGLKPGDQIGFTYEPDTNTLNLLYEKLGRMGALKAFKLSSMNSSSPSLQFKSKTLSKYLRKVLGLSGSGTIRFMHDGKGNFKLKVD